MTITAYSTLNIASAVLIGALGIVIASLRIPARVPTRYYRKARTYLSTAFILLSLLKLVEVAVPKTSDDELTGCIALIAAAFQALCFTASLLLFIQPQWVTSRKVVTHLLGIAAAAAVMLACQNTTSRSTFRLILIGGTISYLALLAYYTLVFTKAYRQFRQEVYDYYQEEDLTRQLRWISHTFYSSLAVGMLVFLSLSGVKWLDCLFIAIYSAFYVYLTVSFINYGQYVTTVMRAVMPDDEATPVAAALPLPASGNSSTVVTIKEIGDTPVKYVHISTAMRQWVDQQKFLHSDIAVKDVARELGTSPRLLNEYFNEVVGEDFVKWRIRLRMSHACKLIELNPNRSITEIATESGFGDRSYFYRKFAELLGISVTEYKRRATLLLSDHIMQQTDPQQ